MKNLYKFLQQKIEYGIIFQAQEVDTVNNTKSQIVNITVDPNKGIS